MLCEKPIALNAREAEDAIRYAEKKRRPRSWRRSCIACIPSGSGPARSVKAEELGTVHSVHTLFAYMLTDPTNIRNVLSYGRRRHPGRRLLRGLHGAVHDRQLVWPGCQPRAPGPRLQNGHPHVGHPGFRNRPVSFHGWHAVVLLAESGCHRIGRRNGEPSFLYNAYPDTPLKLTVVERRRG